MKRRIKEETTDSLLYRHIIENMAEGVFLTRVSDDVIVYANPAIECMFGYAAGELLGKHISIVNAPTDKNPEDVVEEIKRNLEETGAWQGEVFNRRKDGTTFWCSANVARFDHPQHGEVWVSIHQDITERNLAVRALQAQKEHLSLITDNLPVLISHLDRDLKYRFANRAYLDIFGIPPEEMIGRHTAEIIGQDVFERALPNMRKTLAGEAVGFENKVIRQGQERFFETRYVPQLEDGQVVGFYVLGLDVTARKQAEKEILQLNASLEQRVKERTYELGERVKELNCLYGIASLIETPNISIDEILQGAVELLPTAYQYPRNACARLILQDKVYQTANFQETEWKQASDLIMRGVRAGSVEVRYLVERPFLAEETKLINDVAERLVWAIERAWAELEMRQSESQLRAMNEELDLRVRERTGELEQTLQSLQAEIAERKLMEEALRESELKHRTLFESANAGILIMDANSILDCNEKIFPMFGCGREQIIGTSPLHWIFPAAPENAREILASALRGEKRIFEAKLERMDGTTFDAELNLSRIELHGLPYVQAVIQDITGRKQADALRQEVDILREVDRLRAELIGNVSHELRTPLGLILLMATAMLKDELHLDEEQRRNYLRDIEDETRSLQSIVDDLLDISRLQNENLALNLENEDIRETLERAVKLFAAKDADHTLTLRLPDSALEAYMDASRIEQVLRNLLDNAAKFSPPGTSIAVEAKRNGDAIRVSVSDHGQGVPDVERERIFERFYRIVDKNAVHVPGLGLGLSICRGIIEAHGGELWVDDEAQGGSVFTFIIPVQPVREALHESS